MIKTTWTDAMEAAWLDIDLFEQAFNDALEAMTPEAKRDLAAQLLRSANEAEGHPEGPPSEDAACWKGDHVDTAALVRQAYERGQRDERALTELLGPAGADQ